MGDCREFQPAMDCLSDQFYCLAIDLPGHGKTHCPDLDRFYTMANTARGLIEFLEAMQIEKCHLVGYSMGGRLALYLALHFSTYFLKVVLESSSPGLKTPKERSDRLHSDLKLVKALEMEDFSSFLAKWYDQPLFDSIRVRPNFGQLVEQRRQNSPLGLARSLRNFSTGCQPSLWEKLRHNRIPLLLLVGELDKKFAAINAEMAGLYEYAKLTTVPDCGHNIHFEYVDLFIQEIERFLLFPRSPPA